MVSTELYMNFENKDETVVVESFDATEKFEIHPEDFGFIYDQVNEGYISGELQIIVNEGLINVNWMVKSLEFHEVN
jgi:hypothetical protein